MTEWVGLGYTYLSFLSQLALLAILWDLGYKEDSSDALSADDTQEVSMIASEPSTVSFDEEAMIHARIWNNFRRKNAGLDESALSNQTDLENQQNDAESVQTSSQISKLLDQSKMTISDSVEIE